MRNRKTVTGLNDIKKDLFFRLMETAGRVFVLVRYSDRVVIGRRGFSEQERSTGLVLVFNPGMKFTWDETGIHATLVFSSTPEKCHIPPEGIVAVYSPELGVQLTTGVTNEDASVKARSCALAADTSPDSGEPGEPGRVIKVDFGKRADDETA